MNVGNGLVCASFGADGRWLSLGAPHPVHGFVELSALPRFDESWRGDPVAVRRYRSWMADDARAFLRVDGTTTVERVRRTAWTHPVRPAVMAQYRIRRRGDALGPVVVGYRGRLDRPAYAEITDIAPLPPLRTSNRLRVAGNVLRVEAPSLPATATLTLEAGTHPVAWAATDDGAEASVAWTGPADRVLVLSVSCSLCTR